MNSFALHAVGNLARNAEPFQKDCRPYNRFSLVGNGCSDQDEEGTPRAAGTCG